MTLLWKGYIPVKLSHNIIKSTQQHRFYVLLRLGIVYMSVDMRRNGTSENIIRGLPAPFNYRTQSAPLSHYVTSHSSRPNQGLEITAREQDERGYRYSLTHVFDVSLFMMTSFTSESLSGECGLREDQDIANPQWVIETSESVPAYSVPRLEVSMVSRLVFGSISSRTLVAVRCRRWYRGGS